MLLLGRSLALVCSLLVFSSFTLPVLAAGSLEGLRCLKAGARVLIEEVSPEALKYGITSERLKTLAELKLLQNGVKILPDSVNTCPIVYLQLNSVEALECAQLDYSVYLAVEDFVITAQDVGEHLDSKTQVLTMSIEQIAKTFRRAKIWSTGAIGYAGKSRLPEAVYNAISEQMDILVRDYLKMKNTYH
jgi:hypothetical protein